QKWAVKIEQEPAKLTDDLRTIKNRQRAVQIGDPTTNIPCPVLFALFAKRRAAMHSANPITAFVQAARLTTLSAVQYFCFHAAIPFSARAQHFPARRKKETRAR